MRRRIPIVLIGIPVLATLVAFSAAAPAEFHIDWYSFAAGGGRAVSSDYIVVGTCGQAAAGSASGEDLQLGGGFWGGTAPPAVPQTIIYVPLVFRSLGG